MSCDKPQTQHNKILFDGPTNMFCDSEAVFTNTPRFESTLEKKHVAICHHGVRVASKMAMVRIAMDHASTNLADLPTKCLTGPRKAALIQRILY
jgi:hypothetical protein